MPGSKPSTPGATSSTIPAISWPNTAGGTIILAWYPRRNTLASVPQVSATRVRRRMSPASSGGTSTCSTRTSSRP